jgi:hypothetical protein
MPAPPSELSRFSSMRIALGHTGPLPDGQTLIQENATLARQLGEVQRRVTRQLAQQARVIQALQAQCMQLRAAVITRDTALSMLRQHMTVNQVTGPAFNPR